MSAMNKVVIIFHVGEDCQIFFSPKALLISYHILCKVFRETMVMMASTRRISYGMLNENSSYVGVILK